MRIVPNLTELTECPNCHKRRGGLTDYVNDFGRHFLLCMNCQETFYENELTIDIGEARDHAFNIGKAPDAIDDTLMEIEYAVSDLTRYATTQHELDQMERIRNIFDELISVIRRMR